MKPILIAVALLTGTFTKTFASEVPAVQPTVVKSFKSTFATATEVGWSTSNEFYKVEFALNGRYITAYYTADGTMATLTRHIGATELPVILQTAIKNDYKEHWVSDVLEVTKEGDVQYYVTLENADNKIIMKSNSESVWTVYKKSSK